MIDEQAPNDDPQKRSTNRALVGLAFFTVWCAILVGRELASGSSVMSTVSLVGLSGAATVAVVAVAALAQRRSDRRLADQEPENLFTGHANLYLDQLLAAPELKAAAARVRSGWLRLLTQGQCQLSGVVRMDKRSIRWTPDRLTRRFGMQEWTMPLGDIAATGATRTALRLGRGGLVTLHLRSGYPIDLLMNDRTRFSTAWAEASLRPGGANPVPD